MAGIQWWVQLDGEKSGPYSTDEVREFAGDPRFRTARVRVTDGEWQTVEESMFASAAGLERKAPRAAVAAAPPARHVLEGMSLAAVDGWAQRVERDAGLWTWLARLVGFGNGFAAGAAGAVAFMFPAVDQVAVVIAGLLVGIGGAALADRLVCGLTDACRSSAQLSSALARYIETKGRPR